MFSDAWVIFLLSMVPLTELRVTIPIAITTMGMAPWTAFLLATAGNLVPILPVLFLLAPMERLFSHVPWAGVLLQKFLKKARAKGVKVQRYGALGLIIFVGIPLPGTGAWTGAAIAWLLGLPVWTAFLAIVVGVICAGLLITLLSIGLLNVALLYGLEVLLGLLLLLALCMLGWKLWRKKKLF